MKYLLILALLFTGCGEEIKDVSVVGNKIGHGLNVATGKLTHLNQHK